MVDQLPILYSHLWSAAVSQALHQLQSASLHNDIIPSLRSKVRMWLLLYMCNAPSILFTWDWYAKLLWLVQLRAAGLCFLPISQSTRHGCCFSLVTLQVTTTLLVANPLLKILTSFQWYSQGRPGRARTWLILTCQLLCTVTAHR